MLDGGVWSVSHSNHFTPKKVTPQNQTRWVSNALPLPGFHPRTSVSWKLCVCVCVCVSDLWRCSSSWMIPFGQPYLGSLLPASHHTNLNSVSKQFVWGLWWTKWHWDRSSSKYFDFPLSPFCYSLNTYSFTCHKYCVV